PGATVVLDSVGGEPVVVCGAASVDSAAAEWASCDAGCLLPHATNNATETSADLTIAMITRYELVDRAARASATAVPTITSASPHESSSRMISLNSCTIARAD